MHFFLFRFESLQNMQFDSAKDVSILRQTNEHKIAQALENEARDDDTRSGSCRGIFAEARCQVCFGNPFLFTFNVV